MAQAKDPPKLTIHEEIRRLIAVRTPIVYVMTFEEERLECILGQIAQKAFSQPVPFYRWTVTDGLRVVDDQQLEGSEDPVKALDRVIAHSGAAVFLFHGLHRLLQDARVTRRLRDVYRALRNNYKTLFIAAPTLEIPRECEKDVIAIDLPLPGVDELERVFEEVCDGQKNLTVELGAERDALFRGALGLTENEAHGAFTKLVLGRSRVGPEIIEALYEEKRGIVRKEGILDYVTPRVTLGDIGGLRHLKLWLTQRQRFFQREAEEFGLDPPKGLLVTGISGCGKSMVVQSIATFWKMPLIRLDMNRIYAAVSGTPERTLERAIATAEAVSPCVLWIDEIETAIVGTHGVSGSNLSTRIFASFLTWMQEKKHMVFVAATANEIDKLPPELLRKGRFDEIFFVDLPNQEERQDILSKHLSKRGRDAAKYDILSLAKSTTNFNGAELEQLVLSALYTAFHEQRELVDHDLYRALGRMVPLATTMAERIKEIKRWADTRAIKANG